MVSAKQKWLAAGEVVDAARKAWQESLDSQGADYSSALIDYRSAREVEVAAYREFLDSGEAQS